MELALCSERGLAKPGSVSDMGRPVKGPTVGKATCLWGQEHKTTLDTVRTGAPEQWAGSVWGHRAPWFHSAGAAWRAALASMTLDSSLIMSFRILTSRGMLVQRSGSGEERRLPWAAPSTTLDPTLHPQATRSPEWVYAVLRRA